MRGRAIGDHRKRLACISLSCLSFSDTVKHHSGTAPQIALIPKGAMTQPDPLQQIHNRASLEVWMADMPREFVAVIGTRAALRAFPMLARDFAGNMPDAFAAILLPSLRALSIASAGATWPRRVSEIWEFAAAGEPNVQVAGLIAEHARHVTAGRLCRAFADALRLFAQPAAYILHSANATTASAEIVGAGSWEAVSWDARQLPVEWTGAGSAALLAAGLHVRPLWPKGSPSQVSQAWSDLKTALPADEGWWVWTRWYEDQLAGRPPDQSLDLARVAIPGNDWERGPKHVNGIIARLTDTRTPTPYNPPSRTPDPGGESTTPDALRLLDQASILDELIDRPTPDLPPPLPSPVNFQFLDGALHTAEPPMSQLPDFRERSVREAWQALATTLSGLLDDPTGRNNPTLQRVLNACRDAMGKSFDGLQPILLGVHACRLHELAGRADEILLPDTAAELTALSSQIALFLEKFPDWRDYANGSAQAFGTPEAEDQAAREGAAALATIEQVSPEIIAPEAKQALEELQEAAIIDPAADGRNSAPPIARRSWLRAMHNALRSFFAGALAATREGLRTGVKVVVTSATVAGLVAAASYLSAIARALPTEFGWLSRLVAYLQSLL